MNYKDIYEMGQTILQDNDIEEYKLDAFLLFEHIFHIPKTKYYLIMNDLVSPQDLILLEEYLQCIKKRATHIPLQHIIGTSEFMGLKFKVNENVLVPRWDTECLVEKVMNIISKHNNSNPKVLDMCTGSGCIAISLMKLCGLKQITAVDLSKEALNVAKENAKAIDCNVTFIESDLFEKIKDQNFDIIVSNPPYIPTKVIDGLSKEVKLHDPYMALDGDEDGLKFYRQITKDASTKIIDGGYLAYEIGHDQGCAVRAIMEDNGFDDIEVSKDLAGYDRVVIGRMNRRNNNVR